MGKITVVISQLSPRKDQTGGVPPLRVLHATDESLSIETIVKDAAEAWLRDEVGKNNFIGVLDGPVDTAVLAVGSVILKWGPTKSIIEVGHIVNISGWLATYKILLPLGTIQAFVHETKTLGDILQHENRRLTDELAQCTDELKHSADELARCADALACRDALNPRSGRTTEPQKQSKPVESDVKLKLRHDNLLGNVLSEFKKQNSPKSY